MRKTVITIIAVLALIAIAAGAAYTLLPKAPPAAAGGAKGGGATTPAQGEPQEGGAPQDEGKPSDPLPKEDQQLVTAPNGCVEGEPVKHKFNSPDLPRGKLGEWVAAKTKDGKEAVRFRVSLVDVAPMGTLTIKGERTPLIIGRFRIEVENLTCKPFVWNMKHPGFWIGITKRDPNSEIVGWFPSSSMSPVVNEILVAENGHLEGPDPQDIQTTEKVIKERFGELPTPLPKEIAPGTKAEGYFDVVIGNIYLIKGDPYLPVGPEGDGNLPMVIGGYMSYVRVELGSAKSWWEKMADDGDKKLLTKFMSAGKKK